MDTRVAVISIIVEQEDAIEELNAMLHEARQYIVGRMGIPYRPTTNIGYRFSSRAVFGWILFELNSSCGDLGERAEGFCLL